MSAKLSQLGEFGLIELLKRYKGFPAGVMQGIGDDTAVVPMDAKRHLLLTTDMLVENVHFTRRHPPRAIGYKALACSISDIAAMGGNPRYALVSLGVPGNLPLVFVRDLYKGIDTVARKFGVAIVGGDTVKSTKVVVNVALTGEARKRDIVYRGGARPGDLIFVTGALGNSLAAGWHLKFIPRVKEARYLAGHAKLTSMIDISDGLAADLGHILEESRAGAVLKEERIPRRAGASLRQALYDGEDFELLFTVPASEARGLKGQKKFRFFHIGEVVAKTQGLRVQNKSGRLKVIKTKGYTHF